MPRPSSREPAARSHGLTDGVLPLCLSLFLSSAGKQSKRTITHQRCLSYMGRAMAGVEHTARATVAQRRRLPLQARCDHGRLLLSAVVTPSSCLARTHVLWLSGDAHQAAGMAI